MEGKKLEGKKFDVIVIGAGPNGLTCSAYLANAGLSVLLLERRHETGGGLNTEEICGFRFNLHAIYHLMAEIMPPWKDFELSKYGVRYIFPDVQISYLFDDGSALVFFHKPEKSAESISEFSKSDAENFLKMYEEFQKITNEIIIPATYLPPLPPLEQALALQKDEIGRKLNEIADMTPQEILDKYGIKNSRVRMALINLLAMWGISIDEPLGYLFPLYVVRMNNIGICVGGSHRLSSALLKAFIGSGKGVVLEMAEVRKIILQNGKVKGVELKDGREFESDIVVSTCDPNQTFLKFIGEEKLPHELAEAVKDWQWEDKVLFTIHTGLKGTPKYHSKNPQVNFSLITFLGYDTEDELVRYLKTIESGYLPEPMGHVSYPSIFDPIQSPEGYNTGRWECLVPYTSDWDRIKDEYAKRCIDKWKMFVDNLDIVTMYIYPPTYIERKLISMVRGSIKHGAYNPLQMGYFRPNSMCSNTRTPINGLYVCGASVHSGGMITAGPGYICANVVAEDLGLKKWWKLPEFVQKYLGRYIP